MGNTISACLIVKNEEEALPGCLESIQDVVDEIIVVDTGSSDSTKQIAETYGARVHEYEWDGHFGKARNRSIEHATCEWIFRIDADERLSESLRKNLRDLVDTRENVAYKFPQEDEFLEHSSGSPPGTGLVRLFRKGEFVYPEDESGMISEGKEGNIDAESRVLPYPTIHCQRGNHWLVRPSRVLPRLAMEVDRRPKERTSAFYLLKAVVVFCKELIKRIVMRRGYRDGWLGVKFSLLKAFYWFLVYIFIAFKPKDPTIWKTWIQEDS